MKIHALEITNFRNLKTLKTIFSPGINLFFGDNGSGKTSFLEAINYLGIGRSFRTRLLSRIIHHDADHFSLFAQLALQENGNLLPIGISREKESTQHSIKIGGKMASSLAELAQLLPLQLIHADSHQLLTTGPLIRRQFLDWGTFHVEPSFYYHWQRASRLIKQRNAHLKQVTRYQELSHWDEEFVECAQHLDLYRHTYIENLKPLLQSSLELLLERNDFTLHYDRGWHPSKTIKEALEHAFVRDKQQGYTQQGPHRADLQLKIRGIPAQDILSQGQQKVAAYALRLTQGQLLDIKTNKHCIFLIDDLPSELDSQKRFLVANFMKNMNVQLFVTGITHDGLNDLSTLPDAKTFHVERGNISLI